MMRGTIVVITAFFSIIFLKRRLYRHHWLGLALIVLGDVIVGVASISSTSKSGEDAAEELFGIILLIAAQFFFATQFIVEEFFLDGYDLEPFFIVGTEGMWGLAYYLVFLPVMQLIQCGSQNPTGLQRLCNYSYLENSAFLFYQMSLNHLIIMLALFTVVICTFFNAFGISVTKYASAA